MPVAIHPGDAPMMGRGSNDTLRPTNITGRIIMPFVNVPFGSVEPDILIGENYSMREYGLPARIVSTPGHTRGSISLVFDDDRAIVGDLLMGGILGGYVLPRTPGYHYYVENLSQVHHSIKKLLDLGVKEFFPGHGGPLSADSVYRKFRHVLPAAS